MLYRHTLASQAAFRVIVDVMVRVSKLLGSDYVQGTVRVHIYSYGYGTKLGLGWDCSSTLTTY